jgi:hypothetical protein
MKRVKRGLLFFVVFLMLTSALASVSEVTYAANACRYRSCTGQDPNCYQASYCQCSVGPSVCVPVL